MTVKQHYDTHLGQYFSWIKGELWAQKDCFKDFCLQNQLHPEYNAIAVDLGGGNGAEAIALAELGFKVSLIDFNDTLLYENKELKEDLLHKLIYDDFLNFEEHIENDPELIICYGDTLAHLNSFEEVEKLFMQCYSALLPGGKLCLNFRDYSRELTDEERFIHIKNEEHRIATCFLEFIGDKVKVTDLYYENQEKNWNLKKSSYEKIRVTLQSVESAIQSTGFLVTYRQKENGTCTLIAQK